MRIYLHSINFDLKNSNYICHRETFAHPEVATNSNGGTAENFRCPSGWMSWVEVTPSSNTGWKLYWIVQECLHREVSEALICLKSKLLTHLYVHNWFLFYKNNPSLNSSPKLILPRCSNDKILP